MAYTWHIHINIIDTDWCNRVQTTKPPNAATYIRQGGHHVGHWPTFIVCYVLHLLSCTAVLLLVLIYFLYVYVYTNMVK